MSEPAILATGVSKYFGDFPASARRDFGSGAGQSAGHARAQRGGQDDAAAHVRRPVPADAGRYLVSGHLPAAKTTDAAGSASSGTARGSTTISPHEENLRFFCKLHKVPEAGSVVAEWLSRVGLERFRHSRAGEYSRGMRQRLTIARGVLAQAGGAAAGRAVDLLRRPGSGVALLLSRKSPRGQLRRCDLLASIAGGDRGCRRSRAAASRPPCVSRPG